MKAIVKNLLGIAVVALVSAGVAGYTASCVNVQPQEPTFDDLFNTASPLHLASNHATESAGPVDLTQAAESSIHAVVHIRSTQESKTETRQVAPDIFDFFFGDGRGRQQQVQTQPKVGYGSGVIISTDGYIVTNNHVVEGADEIMVKLNDERELSGRVIGTDESTDLALLKIEGEDFPAIVIGSSEDLKVGEWVLAVGNPFNLGSTVTAGIVSAKARSIGTTAANGQAASIQSFIQTDAVINAGNSGGALVNAKGELVGINAMLYSPTGAYSGYGFAIPTTIMTKVVADLKQFGTVQRALLGISCTDLNQGLNVDETNDAVKAIKDKARELGIQEGIWVREVIEDGSADGVLLADDVITHIDGKKIHAFANLQEELAKHRPGDTVTLTILRGGKEKTVTVTLKNEQNNTSVVKKSGIDILGGGFTPLSTEKKRQLGLSYGLEVTGVVADGRMSKAGVRKGFIILKANGQSMHTVDDIESALKAAQSSSEQALFLTGVYPSGRRAMFAVDVAVEE